MTRVRDLIASAILIVLTLVLHRKVVRLWWTWDDFYLLHQILDFKWTAAFYDSAVWPQKLFTPLVLAAYEANLSLWGLDPARWFVVHLAFTILATLAFYATLRLWFTPLGAGAGGVLFVASVPLVSLTTELSGIHYISAILLGSLATIAYVVSLRRGRYWLAIVSAFVLLVGMLFKETIIPLPFLLIALPERDLRARLHHAIPHALALIIYFVWRYAVIGTILGGYGWAIDRGEWLPLIASLPKKIILASAGVGVPIGVALIVLMLIVMIRKRGALLFVLGMALAVGPILPVSKEMQRRYALMPWLCWSVAFVAGAEALRRKHPRAGAAVLIAVPLLMVVANRQEWRYEYGRSLRMSDEGRFFLDMPPDSYFRLPTIPPAALGELNWLKTVHLGKPGGAAWFYDDYFLCTTDVTGKRAWQFVPERRAMIEITSELPGIGRRHCAAIRNDAPLSATFDYRDSALFWTFGPYERGQYRVLLANGVQAFDVPRTDGFRLPDMPGITLRIRYISPEGWTTYSPDLAIDFKKGMVWRR